MSTATDKRYDLLVVGGGPAGLPLRPRPPGAGLDVGARRRAADVRRTDLQAARPGLSSSGTRAALGRDHLRGRRADRAAEASGAELLPSTSAVAIRDDDVVLVPEGGHARTVVRRPAARRSGGARPSRRLPGLDAARRAHRRGGADDREDAARAPGRAARLRGQRAAGARVPRAAPPLRRERARSRSRRARRPGPATSCGSARRRGATRGCCATPSPTARELLRARVPMRYGRIVVRAEGDGRVERVVHAAVDRDWRVIPGTEEQRRGGHALRRLRVLPVGRAAAARGLRLRATTRTSAGRSSSSTSGCGRRRRGVSAAGDGTGVAGAFVAVDEGRLAALGAALDLGALTAAEAERAAAPIRARLRAQGGLPRAHCAGCTRSAPGIYELATADTVVCRCEEVTPAELDAAVEAIGRPQRRQGLHARRHGPLPGRRAASARSPR